MGETRTRSGRAATKKDMPAIQVGDWYLAHGTVYQPAYPWNVSVKDGVITHSHVPLDEIDEIRGERKGKAFIWRR